MNVRKITAALIALMPGNGLRCRLYRHLLGYDIDRATRIGAFTLIVGRHVKLTGANIGRFNVIRTHTLIMQPGSIIGKFNYLSALQGLSIADNAMILHRNFICGTFGNPVTDKGRSYVTIGKRSQFSISNFVDVADTITLGEDVVVGGASTQFWTHGFDHLRNYTSGPIVIADRVFIGAGSIVVQDVQICSDVSIGAGSVVHKSITEPGFYASASLARKRSFLS